jgi:RNA polymerase sigma-70 factor (sigma-E family)
VAHESFDAFVAARLPALLRYARVLTASAGDAEDLVQEALVRVGAAWWRVRRRDDPEGYVRRTMLRLAINAGRRRREIAVADVPERGETDPGFARVEDGEELARLVDGLPAGMRAVLVLRYLDGLDDDAIAAVLGCSRVTVRSQASRALARLRARPTEVADGRD